MSNPTLDAVDHAVADIANGHRLPDLAAVGH